MRKSVFERIEQGEPEIEKKLSDDELMRMIWDIGIDKYGEIARKYSPDSEMREIIDTAHTQEGQSFVKKLRSELKTREIYSKQKRSNP